MWSPDGYISWADMVAGLREDVAKILYRAVTITHPGLYADPEYTTPRGTEAALVRSGLNNTQQEAELTLAISTAWVVTNFLCDFPPVAVGLTGGKVALPPVFFEHMDQFDLCPFSWPLHKASEYAGFYEYHHRNGFRAADLLQRFAFVDFESGRMRVRNGTRHFLINGYGLSPQEADEALDLAGKLQDFVLCWEMAPNLGDYRSFLSGMEATPALEQAINELFGAAEDDETNGRNGPGRPQKVGHVKQYLESLPRLEVSGLTQKELARRFRDDTGLSVAPRTIARALAEARSKRVPE